MPRPEKADIVPLLPSPIHFSKKDFEELQSRENIDNLIPEEELENLKLLRTEVGTDYINLARLFIRCFDHFQANIAALEFPRLVLFLDQYSFVENLRDLLSQYGGGEGFGDYFTEKRILRITSTQRPQILELITLFFSIFGGDL